MVELVRSITDIERLVYARGRNLGSFDRFVRKADAPWTTSTAGGYNAIFAAFAWLNANLEANGWGISKKYGWRHSGFRTLAGKVTALTPADSTHTKYGGISETGTLSDTAKPAVDQHSLIPKVLHVPFETSSLQESLIQKSSDDLWGGLGQLRLYWASQFKEFLNIALLADIHQTAVASGGNQTAKLDLESLDVIISSKAEANNATANLHYYDPWLDAKILRDTTTTYDSVVQSASGSLGTLGNLTDDVFRTWMRAIHKAVGYYPTVILTSEEGYSEIQGLYNGQVRYQEYGEGMFQTDVNGISTFNGKRAGIHVSTMYGVPVVPSKDTPHDANVANEYGRIIALDMSDREGWGYPAFGIQVLDPIMYYEAGRDAPGYPFILGKFSEKGVYVTRQDAVCRKFTGQGKLRDLQL